MRVRTIVFVVVTLAWTCSVESMPDTVSSLNLERLASCPCNNAKLCEPITEMGRKEQFAFSVKNDVRYWNLYDWSKLTTVATADYINISLVCLAHSHNARVIYMAPVDEKTFMDPVLRTKWVDIHLQLVRDNHLDGLNFDYEGAIGQNETTKRDAYTALVRETRQRLQKEFPFSMVAVDVGWRPHVDERYYDYPALAQNSDFLVLMAYDEQSQIYGECVAGPNCPLPPTSRGIADFESYPVSNIPPEKLVLAIPWFGISYECLKTDNEKCYIKKIPYRGAPCSDSPGQPYDYKDIHKLRSQIPPDNYKWNVSSSTPYLMYTNASTGTTYQIHYDNVDSLKYKYQLVTTLKLRGVGIFTIDMLDYTDTPAGAKMRAAMFGALPPTNELGNTGVSRESSAHLDMKATLRQRPACPCSDTKLCEPIKTRNKKEIVAFSLHNDESHWRLFDWSKLTTVVMFNYINTSLMCLAHSHRVRVVGLGSVTEKVIFSSKLRSQWVGQQLMTVYNNYLDGINFDFEKPCSKKQSYLRKSYTKLVQETSNRFRKAMPHTQISVDVIDSATSGYRAYDYPGLAKASDFLFIMAYDESTLKVGANSDYFTAKWGIQTYLKANIPASKLVLGLPWYGQVYQCSKLEGDKCIQQSGQTRPLYQVCFCAISDMLDHWPHRLRWNKNTKTPYFNYESSGKSFQIQFDNPRSLQVKYELAGRLGIRGVGIWHLDCLNFSNTQKDKNMRDKMFGILPNKEVTGPGDESLRLEAEQKPKKISTENSRQGTLEKLTISMDIP